MSKKRRRSARPTEPVRMLVADAEGWIYDHPELTLAGERGAGPEPIDVDELIPLPRGSDLFTLPGRRPVGVEAGTGRVVAWDGEGEEVLGVSAFLAPAWTMYLHPAYRPLPDAPALPLYAYATLGYADGGFWTAAERVDEDDPKVLGTLLAQTLKAERLSLRGDVTVGFGADDLLLRVVRLPSMDVHELQGMVELQVDKFSPFSSSCENWNGTAIVPSARVTGQLPISPITHAFLPSHTARNG